MKKLPLMIIIVSILGYSTVGVASNKLINQPLAHSELGKIASVGETIPENLQGKPLVVKIHSDSCGTCRAISQITESLQEKYGDRVNFVVFDITDKNKIEASEAKAKELGLESFFSENKTQRSTVAIINPDNGEILTKMVGNVNESDYVNAIDSALGEISKK